MSNIIYEPTPSQKKFHQSSSDWVIISGNRGGGKTFAILIEALGLAYNSHIKGGWQCLIIRRTFPQLSEIITRSRELYPKIIKDITYNSQQHRFTFPNGSFVEFSSCERDEDVEKFRGKEYSLIIIDELSHFNSDYVWQFLKGSNRNSKGYPNRMVGTSNPAKWVKDMCQLDDYGNDNKIEYCYEKEGRTIKKVLENIKFDMSDNRHLPFDYKESLMGLPQDLIDEWVYGLWSNPRVKGSIYTDLLSEARKEHRICSVKKEQSSDIFVVFDLGWNDQTAIIFAQFVGKEIRIFDHIEDRQQDIDYYFGVVRERVGAGNNIQIILPHDARAKSLQTGRSIEEKAKEIFPNVEVLVRENIETGITMAKEMFKNLWIEKSLERFIVCLESYRRKHNPTTNLYETPIHDEYSNTADAFRYLAMCKPKQSINILKIQPNMSQFTPW